MYRGTGSTSGDLPEKMILAEVVRTYSQFQIPDLPADEDPATAADPSLLDQAGGRFVMRPAQDVEREPRDRHSVRLSKRADVIRLYRSGLSVRAIRKICHLRWTSVAQILAEAGERPLRKS
jgi:hypothetical protein